MAANDVVEDLKRDREQLTDQLRTLTGGNIQLGTPESHDARLHWLRGQIVALNIAIRKIEASDA